MQIPGSSSAALKTNYNQNRLKYNAIEYDTAFGLDYNEARYRNLDPEIGRWTQIDPKPDYSESLFSSMGNDPILHNDLLGDTIRTEFRTGFLGIFGNKVTLDYSNGKYYIAGTNTEYTGKLGNYQESLLGDLITLSDNSVTSSMIKDFVNKTKVIQIENGGSPESGGGSFESQSAAANPFKPLIVNYSTLKSYNSSDVNQDNSNTRIPGYVALAHEFAHVKDWMTSGRTNFTTSTAWYTSSIDGRVVARSEIYATDLENQLRANLRLPLREFYATDKSKGIQEGRILLRGTRTNTNWMFVNNGINL